MTCNFIKNRLQHMCFSMNFAVFLRTHFLQNSSGDCFYKFSFIRNKVVWEHLYSGLRAATLLKKRLWHMCFPVNFVKFLRTPFFIKHFWWLLLKYNMLVKAIQQWIFRFVVGFSVFLNSGFIDIKTIWQLATSLQKIHFYVNSFSHLIVTRALGMQSCK